MSDGEKSPGPTLIKKEHDGRESNVDYSNGSTNVNSQTGDDNVENTSDVVLQVSPFMIYRTICLYVTFLGLGWSASILGATLVNMEVLYNTQTRIIALTLSFGSVGYLSGSFLCGVIFDRFNSELQFAIACMLMGAATLSAPWMPYLYGFMILMMAGATAGGFIDAGGNSYCVNLWTGHKWKGAILQASHMMWSVGSTTGPLIVKPFLTEINTDPANITSNLTFEFHNLTNLKDNFTDFEDILDVSRVRFAYTLLGVLIILIGGFYILAFFIGGVTCRKQTRIADDENTELNNRPKAHRYFTLTVLGMTLFFYVLYDHVENIPGNFIASFSVKQLGWSVDSSSVLLSWYWGAILLGRVFGIPISLLLTPKQMILINLTVTSAGFTLMCFIMYLPDYFMFISVAILGLGMATTFPSGILWLSKWMAVTGRTSSILLFSSCTGSMVTYVYTGYIFQSVSYMVVLYLPLVASLLMIALFLAMLSFTSWYQRKHPYTTKPEQTETELTTIPQQTL